MSLEQVLLQNFGDERQCTYRGEAYAVRDNGSVLRRAPGGGRRRPLDDVWTFGSASATDGYMSISGHKVHRIVATAFHGEQPSPAHVVDHVDTNRRNNRPDNLRWVTRLENILLNPISAKRVVALYGSIEEFLADPSSPKNGAPSAEFHWMRSVSQAEAAYSRDRMLSWALSDRSGRGGSLGEWIFGRGAPTPQVPPQPALVQSKTTGALQRNWRVPAEFPLCPDPNVAQALERYHQRLKQKEIMVVSPYGATKVGEVAWSADHGALFVLGEQDPEAIKPWSLVKITLENQAFVHESLGTFFQRDGAEKNLVIASGLTWEGGEVFDDYT